MVAEDGDQMSNVLRNEQPVDNLAVIHSLMLNEVFAMKTNMGKTDRTLRAIVGIGLISLAFVGPQTP
jgi:hypothetical protein